MIAAGWDTVFKVTGTVVGIWIVVCTGFTLGWIRYKRQQKADAELRALLQADVDMEIDAYRHLIEQCSGIYDQDVDEVNETNVDRWAGQILTASTAKIISEALR